MTRKRLTPIILAVLIAATLAGAYLIVARNDSVMEGSGETPAPSFH